MKLKCYDLGCPLSDRCALHVDGEPESGEEWMTSLFPYDIPLSDKCTNFVEKGESDGKGT